MTRNSMFRVAMAIFFSATAASLPGEAGTPAQPEAEKAAYAKSSPGTNLDMAGIVTKRGVTCLGMTLVDPTAELMRQFGLSDQYAAPIIVQVQDPSYFRKGMAPSAGCAFWIIEHPAPGFPVNKQGTPHYTPKDIHQLIQAILSATVTPEEYREIVEQTREVLRERAETLKDKPAERQRLLKEADRPMRSDEVGKYICRVVYHYPHGKGTMTTYIHMSSGDLHSLRELLKK